MASDTSQSPAYQRFHNSRMEYEAYLPLTERVQDDLKNDAEELRAQEGWDQDTWNGVEEWIDDKDTIFRNLRRHRFDETKTQSSLLTTLQQRRKLSLHSPIPTFPPYTETPLFFILPLPEHTDLLGRPIAVLTVREVVRDADGRLDDLKQYAWWALEMVRRVLRDYWVKGNWSPDKGKGKGKGGEGLCLIVDANGAGYRNMEVELLPTLLSVGHNNFPGMIESVYVVNAGWTHRQMWNVISRVLPKSALEKVAFLDNQASLAAVFDFDQLPQTYGGKHSYTFSTAHNPIFIHSSHYSSTDHPFLASRNSSYSSIADIYFSAPNTPARSRRNSSAGGGGGGWGVGGKFGSRLRMTKSREARSPIDVADQTEVPAEMEIAIEEVTPIPQSHTHPFNDNPPKKYPISRRNSSRASPSIIDKKIIDKNVILGNSHTNGTANESSQSQSALQRIKSLSDFHLYLSPSRLAHIDLLSDSDPEDDHTSSPPPPLKRTLKPVLFESDRSLFERRERPPLRLLAGGKGEQQNVRSYSDRLQLHHAKVLERYTTPQSRLGLTEMPSDLASPKADSSSVVSSSTSNSGTPLALDRLEPSSIDESATDTPVSLSADRHVLGVYDTSNPWFGYPVVRVPSPSGGSQIRPRYSRNRKRDLIKTLLFLFMLRLQSWRDSIERFLGLNAILNRNRDIKANGTVGPIEGLVSSTIGGREVMRKKGERDWWWMIIGFLLLRGTWSRMLIAPLEAVGWGREILGL
ncbi:uncharacterized protein IL334_000316 [Kwoniella shivajii]|uniref:CRAL-TRIO domain-containing protein n=1 Tax=Kwoniella shivajii TaxID=564305 RepID=A0ABZ1CRV1_9TREE|nr:hypothetical protein IL334_000316 [Kwoniella shivajii]